MKLMLVGVYSDGSNARHMLDDVLLEYDVGKLDDRDPVLTQLEVARKALRASNGAYGDYLIILEFEGFERKKMS